MNSTVIPTLPPMSRVATMTIAALLGVVCLAGEAMAATKECRHIQSRKERNTCYEEQAQAKAKAKAAPARAPMDAQLEQMKRENERVQQRVKSICRGC